MESGSRERERERERESSAAQAVGASVGQTAAANLNSRVQAGNLAINQPVVFGAQSSMTDLFGASAQNAGMAGAGASVPATYGSQTGDVVLKNGKNGASRGWLIVAVAVAAVAVVVAGIVALVMNLGGGSSKAGDGGVTDAKLVKLMVDSYGDISAIQTTFSDASKGRLSSDGFFDEETKVAMESFAADINNFYAALESIDVAKISSDAAREDMKKLKDVLSGDLDIYDNTLKIYGLFYEYVNGGYDVSVASEIKNWDGGVAVETLDDLDAIVLSTGGYSSGTIVRDLFAIYVPEDWPREYYYEYIGYIAGEIGDESAKE